MSAAKTIEARLRFETDSELYKLEFRALGTNCRAAFTADNNDRASVFAKATAQWVADSETNRLFDVCASVYESTDGLVDATALPLLRLWDYRAQPVRIPATSSCLLGLYEGIAEIESAYPGEGRIHQDKQTVSTKGFHEYILCM